MSVLGPSVSWIPCFTHQSSLLGARVPKPVLRELTVCRGDVQVFWAALKQTVLTDGLINSFNEYLLNLYYVCEIDI